MLKKFFALSGFKVALLATLFIMGLFIFNNYVSLSGSFLNLMDKKWVDFIVKEREVQPHTSEVVIATIDTKSVDKYGRWPWPREIMSKMVDAMNDHYEVATIGFDIVFSEPEHITGLEVLQNSRAQFASLTQNGNNQAGQFLKYLDDSLANLDGDAKFGRSLKKKPSSVLGYFFFSAGSELEHLKEEEIIASAERISGSEVSLIQGVVPSWAVPQGQVVESNIQKIYAGGAYSGFFNMRPDSEDGTVRRVHLLMGYEENIFPSLDLQILRHYYGADNIQVIAEEDFGIAAIQVGEKVIFPNFDGSIMLNYKGGIGTFPHYSVFDIIEGLVPKEALQDKIVLIGATEVGIFDLRTTPVSVAYPGVEVHATLLDNILTDSYFQLTDINDMFSLLLILGFGLLLGITLPNLASIYGTVLAVVLVGVYMAVHRWMVMDLRTWTSAIYPALVIISVWGLVTLFRFLVTDRDKRFIKGAFQQYLSPDVINQLMDDPHMLKLGGERREMTAFFSGVQGFSTISEQLEPEELVQLLNVYLTEMSNIAMSYGATIDKYEGDAIISFVGAPMPYEDHALRACQLSLDMQAKLAEMRDGWRAEGKHELLQRIGLNSGPMVVGNMGSENRFDYTMMGNAVNLAARLEGANKNYGTFTMCSEFTYEPTKEHIEYRELDLIRVMGINTPVRIYELLGRKGDLTEELTKGVAYFAKGLELYRGQQWDEAIKYLNAVFKFIPDDPPSKEFISRSQRFKESPPVPEGEEWDGVFTASSK